MKTVSLQQLSLIRFDLRYCQDVFQSSNSNKCYYWEQKQEHLFIFNHLLNCFPELESTMFYITVIHHKGTSGKIKASLAIQFDCLWYL